MLKPKKLLTTVIKVIFTLIALYWVFSKVEFKDIVEIILGADIFYLLFALTLFNLSKILSSVRLNSYFQQISLHISQMYALKLYYVGMFYNLFLPGGIGGDGYKIYLLNKSHRIKASRLIQATLLDRLSGLVPLLFFAGVLFLFSEFHELNVWLDVFAYIGILVVFPMFYMLNLRFFKDFIPVFFKTTLYGAIVQLLQLFSALGIVYALGSESQAVIFLTLFLCSSVVAVLPISIGGVGVRELTFVYGLALLEMDAGDGVAFSLLFFLITAFSSLIGLFLSTKEKI